MPFENIPPTMLALDAETLASLLRLAALRDATVHSLLQDAVRQYLNSAQSREQLLRESIDAWADFPHQSERMSSEQRDAWVAMLEAGAGAVERGSSN